MRWTGEAGRVVRVPVGILLERADDAMYEAKRAGRNTWRTFGVPGGQVSGTP